MAKRLLLLLLTISISVAATSDQAYRQEKHTHLHFYWHDVISGRNPTSVTVARAASTNASATFFGVVQVTDSPSTTGPELSSPLVGRAQGLYSLASQHEVAVFTAMNLAFVDGEYNGSTITVLGRNAVFSEKVREMPVVGGTGFFRFARGYVEVRTHSFDLKTGDATGEYNVFVWHQ